MSPKTPKYSDDSKPPRLPKSTRRKSAKSHHHDDYADLNTEPRISSRIKSSKNISETIDSFEDPQQSERLYSATVKETKSMETGSRVSSAKQRPKSSRPVSRAKSSQSRPGSRARSRANSRLNG